MAAEVLRRRVDHDVGAPLERPQQIGRRDRVVHDERHARCVGHARDGLDVEDLGLRVGDGLAEEELGVRPHRRPPRVDVLGVLDEGHLEAELRQRVLQEVDGPAVERWARHDVVARLGDVEDGEGRGGLPGRHEQRPDAALQRGDALLDGILRRVHDPRVDVAELLEGKEVRGVLGVLEDIRGGLVDRQGAGTGRRVRLLSGVDLSGLEGPVRGLAHGGFLARRYAVCPSPPFPPRAWAHRCGRCGSRGSALAVSRVARGQVLTRGTPPRLEGCRSASRGLTLTLMTCAQDTRCEAGCRNARLSMWTPADPERPTPRAA